VNGNRRISSGIILAIHRHPHPRRCCEKSEDEHEDDDENENPPNNSRIATRTFRTVGVRAKSGRMPDLTGWNRLPAGCFGHLAQNVGRGSRATLANVRMVGVRAKSGKMPDLTGWKPVPPGARRIAVVR